MRTVKKRIIDKPESNCGTVAVFDHPEAAYLAYLALYALQHRGQESAGIVASDGDTVSKHVGRGVVADVFSNQQKFQTLKGHIAIGHNRYSTTGGTNIHGPGMPCCRPLILVSYPGIS